MFALLCIKQRRFSCLHRLCAGAGGCFPAVAHTVRCTGLLWLQVITPVRRSARKSLGGALAASMLEEHGYAYAPNEALGPRRAALFDHVDMAGPPAEDRPDGLVQQGSHASLSPGSATGIDISDGQSVPSSSPEAAPWLAATQRQAQRCFSIAAEAPEAEASVADAVPPFSPLHVPAPQAAASSAATGPAVSPLEPEAPPKPQRTRLGASSSGRLSAKVGCFLASKCSWKHPVPVD